MIRDQLCLEENLKIFKLGFDFGTEIVNYQIDTST